MNLVNCTKHPIYLFNGKVYPPSGITISVIKGHSKSDENDICDEWVERVVNLPPRRPKTLYIVPRIVYTTCTYRDDFICPDISSKRTTKTANGYRVTIRGFKRYFDRVPASDVVA